MIEIGDWWSAADALAGVLALALVLSSQLPPARSLIATTVDVVLGPVEAALPFPLVVAVLAVLTGAVGLAARRARAGETPDSERMAELREQLRTASEADDEAAVEELPSEQASLVRQQLVSRLRPMAWTALVTVPLFTWLYWLSLSPTAAITPVVSVLPVLGEVAWTASVVGPVYAWTLWYLLCSTVVSLTLRRAAARVSPAH